MWLQLGLASGVVIVIFAVLKRVFRGRRNKIDAGAVNEAWLAEQRRRRDDSS